MKCLKEFIKDEHAQAGGVIHFVLTVFIFSFIYVALSKFMAVLSEHSITIGEIYPHSNEYHSAMELCFKTWYLLPVIIILILVVFVIKNAIRSRSGEI